MVGETSKKRQRRDGYRRKHDRNKFRRTTNATVRRKDLGNGLKGFLFSCTPHHENHCFREGVLLLGKFCEESTKEPVNEAEKKEQSLEDELNDLRSGEGNLFTRIDGGVAGAVFLKINSDKIDIEHVVESALRDARSTGNPGSRHCIRLLPIYTTCYAKAEDAAKAAAIVVKEHFPKIEDKPITYAIAFRSRINSSAKRDDFIPAVAAAIGKIEPRYKVNLTKPDVVLLVEVLKTSCCIGVFRHYYELAKMNLREAACPSKRNETKEKEKSVANGDQNVISGAKTGGTDVENKSDVDKTPEVKSKGSNTGEVQDSKSIETHSGEKTKHIPTREEECQKAKEGENEEDKAKGDADDGTKVVPKEPDSGHGEVENNAETDIGDVHVEKASESKNDIEHVQQKT